GPAVAAVGVRVAPLEQQVIARLDRRLVGPGLQIQVGQGLALQPADAGPGRLLGPGGAALAAEQAEGVLPGARAGGVARAEFGGEGGRLARQPARLHLPGRPPAGGRLAGLVLAHLALAHAGEVVPALIVFGRVALAEIIEVVGPVARA